MRVLIVEDDPNVASLIKKTCVAAGFSGDIYDTIAHAFNAVLSVQYSAVILDRNLPDGDGISLIARLKRAIPSDKLPPFLILSALGDSTEKIDGLTCGAVDYMVKPYAPDELIARLRICMASKSSIVNYSVEYSNITYDTFNQKFEVDGKPLQLRRREMMVFDLLFKNRGTVVHHERLENYVYGIGESISSNALNAHVSRLRRAIDKAGAQVSITVMRNIGYILQEHK